MITVISIIIMITVEEHVQVNKIRNILMITIKK